MTSQHDLHEFLALNPDSGPQTGVREWEVLRSQGRRVVFALVDEHDGRPAQVRGQIARRAEVARQDGEAREARLEERFARLNPEFGVLPSRVDPAQHASRSSGNVPWHWAAGSTWPRPARTREAAS